jgi:Flp pilus assembly CpaF family ATPase
VVIEDGGLQSLLDTSGPQRRREPEVHSAELLQYIRDALVERLPAELLDPVAPASERNPAVLRVLRMLIGEHQERGGLLSPLAVGEVDLLRLYHAALGWGAAQLYLDDERIQEVKLIGAQIMVQEEGADFALMPERFATPAEPLARALLLADRLGVRLDRNAPQATLPLAHGTRMHVTIPPCTPAGEALICIRRGRRRPWSLDDILARRACDEPVAALLALLVRARCSFLIAGETGSGKTALLEALVNSWPGAPHVLTIEDNTLEINVRHASWTRELVQTSLEPGAYGRAAREALRQTPSLVAPGETRAEEAGAILSIAVSGHPVLTTIHAKSAYQALLGFADRAAMPTAYTYANRRDDALEDLCDNLEVVIHLTRIGGQRFIREIILSDGCEPGPRPRALPLVALDFDTSGEPLWRCHAAVDGDDLSWQGTQQTPVGLARKLLELRAASAAHAGALSRQDMVAVITRAENALQADKGEQALAIVRHAWAERHDQRLLSIARRALESRIDGYREKAAEAETALASVLQLSTTRRWAEAAAAFSALYRQVELVAVAAPSGGWHALEACINKGLASERSCAERLAQARSALNAGFAHEVLSSLAALDLALLSPISALAVLNERRRALHVLVIAGEIGEQAIRAIDAQIAGLS